MKTIVFVMLIGLLTVGQARAQFGYDAVCQGHSACAHNNSKACVDARNAFARHHNGMYPEQFCNQYYQGQRGRWVRHGNQWAWAGSEGNEWQDGRRGHWFQEKNGWQFRSDKGEDYSKGPNGWQWSGKPQPKQVARDHGGMTSEHGAHQHGKHN